MRASSTALLAILVFGCSSRSATEPRTTDPDVAYAQWSAFHPPSYTFDFGVRTSMTPARTYHVTVANGQVVDARTLFGAAISSFTFTIDTLWNEIHRARESGSLNSAVFSLSGVPLDTDMGEWASDGGVHYTVSNFSVTR
jgi:hypothetical protein